MLAGQLSMKSTPSRLGPCARPEEHCCMSRKADELAGASQFMAQDDGRWTMLEEADSDR